MKQSLGLVPRQGVDSTRDVRFRRLIYQASHNLCIAHLVKDPVVDQAGVTLQVTCLLEL
jgi:hypothetical protein